MERSPAPLQTLDRGLHVLELLAEAGNGLAVADLADELGVDRAIVYRLVATLAGRRFVARGDDGRYRLGTGLVRLAGGVSARLQTAALPELTRLAEEVGATATLTVADGDDAVALTVVEPRKTAIHVAYRPGLRHPLDVGASGRAILLGRDPAPSDPPSLARARKRGWVTSKGELQPGAVGVAAPVRGADASVAVVSFVELAADVGARVVEAAEAVADALG